MNNSTELGQYISIAIKWWWALCLAAVLGSGIGYWISQRLPPVYQATTTVIVGQSLQATNLDRTDIEISDRLALTYVDLVRREPVMQGTIDALSLTDTWQNLRKRVRVELVQDTQLLEITVEAHTPEEARRIADEIAHQLILLSPTALQNQAETEQQEFVRYQLKNLQAKIEAGHQRLKTLEAAMNASLSAQEVAKLQNEINILEKLLTDWENNYTQLLIITEQKKSPNYLAIIEPAQVNFGNVQPSVELNAVLAGLLGLILVSGLIFLREFLDATFKSTDDLSRTLGVTVLGTIGLIKGKHYPNKLITAQNPYSPITEAYRMLRSSVQLMDTNRQAKSIVVTSSNPAEGKSITVANLATVMAQAGLKTVIVDSDLRWPVQHEIFQVTNKVGLTELLNSPVLKVESCLRKTGIKNLQILTSGEISPNPSELLGSVRMEQVVTKLNEMADVIIYDSPPILAVTDATVLSNRVDGTVLVIRAGYTHRNAAKQANSILQQAEANVLGVVLNRLSAKPKRHYYQSYYTPRNPTSAEQPSHSPPRRRWQWLPFFK